MIAVRRSTERSHARSGAREVWRTFDTRGPPGPRTDGFGALRALDEMRLPPGAVCASQVPRESEIITYLYRGALAQSDSTGGSGVVHAGEFQRMTGGRGVRHQELNGSGTVAAHLFRISLRASELGLVCSHEQRRFAEAQRHNMLRVVASPDGRAGSLRLLQDAVILSSVLDPGHHAIHELLPGRSAWLHVVGGEATLQDIVLTQGDGVGVTMERAVSLTANESTEILLIDLGGERRGP